MIIAAALLALAWQSISPADVRGSVTDLGDVVVVGGHPTGLLRVVVEGQVTERTLVASEPDLRCGPVAYRWEDFGRPRLCWLRRRLDSAVVLSATHPGRPGSDWIVDWDGCDRVIGPDRCEVLIQPAREVRATFRRVG